MHPSIDLVSAKYSFVASLAGYSLVCYVLQIKDRHNGNILLDKYGHMIHIDFDYFISNSPGNNFHFEKAPFKLTEEYVELMEGRRSEYFQHFRHLMTSGIIALQKEYRKIVTLIAMMLNVNKNLPCFVSEEKIIYELQERLFPRVNQGGMKTVPMNEEEAAKFIDR